MSASYRIAMHFKRLSFEMLICFVLFVYSFQTSIAAVTISFVIWKKKQFYI